MRLFFSFQRGFTNRNVKVKDEHGKLRYRSNVNTGDEERHLPDAVNGAFFDGGLKSRTGGK